MNSPAAITVAGAGLAGCEAAWQIAGCGIPVRLYEMRPRRTTGAHRTEALAELVCSNSLGSRSAERGAGLLQDECRRLGSLLLACAERHAVPAGGALAVDRAAFADEVSARILRHPLIRLERRELTARPPAPAVIATGPLTSPALARDLERELGAHTLYFYDALAPIVSAESIDFERAFYASRYERGGEHDYVNCPFSEEEYDLFLNALLQAERIPLQPFERDIEQGVNAGRGPYFEGCLPIEVLARRGRRALAYGPLRPVGLRTPRDGRRPFAVLQCRRDNATASLFNLVGFQTNLTFAEQRRVLRLVPGLERAEFSRFGQMHRNTYLCAPAVLDATLQTRACPGLFIAGQLAGVEGYAGAIATGCAAGLNAARWARSQPPFVFPRETMLGALTHYLQEADPASFQPMKAQFGLLPPLPSTTRQTKRERKAALARRAQEALTVFIPSLEGRPRASAREARP